MENELLHRRRRKRGGSGLRKARCVVRCRSKSGRGKRKTLTQCRRKCKVKGKR